MDTVGWIGTAFLLVGLGLMLVVAWKDPTSFGPLRSRWGAGLALLALVAFVLQLVGSLIDGDAASATRSGTGLVLVVALVWRLWAGGRRPNPSGPPHQL